MRHSNDRLAGSAARRARGASAVLAAGLAVAAGMAVTGVAPGTASAAVADGTGAGATVVHGQVRGSLPALTGPYRVGTASLHLIDRSRPDPWVDDPPYRELMVSLFYPASGTAGRASAPYMLPKAAAHFDSVDTNDYLGLSLPTGAVDWSATDTHAYPDAPVDRRAGKLPVVLFSPGLGEPRTWSTTLVEQLASRGYLVVTIDNTYESPEVQFPDGRLEVLTDPQPTVDWVTKLITTRSADTSFVLDELTAIDRGGHRDSAVPAGLAGAMNLAEVGMFGHSAGGFAAAQAMYDDPRIKAGVNLDGTMTLNPDSSAANDPAYFPDVVTSGLDRPFLLIGSDGEGGESVTDDASWASFRAHSTGWQADLTLRGSDHASFTDAETLVPQIASALHLPAQTVTGDIGTLDPDRAVTVEDDYLSAFFDRFLRHRDGHLLDGPSPRYPEMSFVG
ncbi:alpha/beta hydrolase [Rugosimonospora acidiphila]|uniref:Alpha/beta hydrolase n=1 Tax=Rugosimonospora acidiphila TaxID=556531 RepID=A0ABP9ST97_9ACTN